MPKHRVKLLQCPNCNTSLPAAENYCPNCGQENHDIIRPIGHLWNELLGNVFNIDSRFLHTVKALFLNPGKLTKEYNAGKRRYYLPPVRIYLIASVLFFLSQSISMKLSDQQLNQIRSTFSDNPTDSIDLQLFNKVLKVSNLELLELSNYSDDQLDSFLINKDLEPNFFHRKIVGQGSKLANGNMNNLSEKFQQYLSFAMFLFMPIMGLLLMLFYYRQKRFYVEHLIFSLHFHAVAFFIMSGLGLIAFLPSTLMPMVSNLLLLLVIFYLLLYLKNVYQASWKTTIFKFLGLVLTYGILVSIGVTGIALLALIIF